MEKIYKTDAEWRAQLSPEAYKILRKHATERAGTGPNSDSKEKGTYVCAACGLRLFSSEAKYDSGTGWPSFYAPIEKQNVETKDDSSLFTRRTEVHCARCEGHLGHVFPDGPKPTGLRYCMNGYAMKLEKAE